jgi:lipopolysaccharide transport system ATP-binding protein
MPDALSTSQPELAQDAVASKGARVFLRLANVTLRLPVYLQHDRGTGSWLKTLVAAATDRPERKLRTILSDINLSFEDGDRVALIGRNGAGKTTLLNVLTGCYEPTSGQIAVSGSRQALLNVSLGFNYEATVRENVLLRGTAMGIGMSDLQQLVDPILEFANLRDVAHHRLGTLSAGQRMRLGFAISTSIQPDIMLLDEWIGAGDAEFVAKARQRMQDRVNGSRLLVLASHSPDLLKRVCNRGVVLQSGTVQFDGPIAEALRFYDESLQPVSDAVQATPKAIADFHRRGIPHGKRYGLIFRSPVHCLFDNRTVDAETGLSSYGCLIETDASAVSEAFNDLMTGLTARGFTLEASAGGALPNAFTCRGPDGESATITLTPYRKGDRRESPSASGRIHIRLTDWQI